MSGPSFSLGDIFGVEGKVVLITGGGTGIGKAITAAFATNGAKVFISGRRMEVLEAAAKEIGGDITCVQGDVSTKSGCEAMIDSLSSHTSYLDTLVNCAGVNVPVRHSSHQHNTPSEVEALLASATDDDWTNANAINVAGVYYTTVFSLPLLQKASYDHGGPSVINIASIAGMMSQRSLGGVIYGTSKAGTIHVSRLLAGRLAPMKIRVNCVCPGIFPSEMTGKAAGGAGKGYELNHNMDKASKRSIMGRAGEPEEIAGPVLMLASKAGMYMTAAVLVVDGGRTQTASIHDGLRIPEELYTFDDI